MEAGSREFNLGFAAGIILALALGVFAVVGDSSDLLTGIHFLIWAGFFFVVLYALDKKPGKPWAESGYGTGTYLILLLSAAIATWAPYSFENSWNWGSMSDALSFWSLTGIYAFGMLFFSTGALVLLLRMTGKVAFKGNWGNVLRAIALLIAAAFLSTVLSYVMLRAPQDSSMQGTVRSLVMGLAYVCLMAVWLACYRWKWFSLNDVGISRPQLSQLKNPRGLVVVVLYAAVFAFLHVLITGLSINLGFSSSILGIVPNLLPFVFSYAYLVVSEPGRAFYRWSKPIFLLSGFVVGTLICFQGEAYRLWSIIFHVCALFTNSISFLIGTLSSSISYFIAFAVCAICFYLFTFLLKAHSLHIGHPGGNVAFLVCACFIATAVLAAAFGLIANIPYAGYTFDLFSGVNVFMTEFSQAAAFCLLFHAVDLDLEVAKTDDTLEMESHAGERELLH